MALAARKCITGLRNDSLPLVPRCQLPLFPAQTASEPWAGSSPPSSILQLSAASTAGGAYVLKSNGDPGFYRDFGRREISQEGFPQTWNSQKKKKKKKKNPKTSWIRFPLLKGLVLESKQPLCLRTGPAVLRRMELLLMIFLVQREERTQERNACKKRVTFKHESLQRPVARLQTQGSPWTSDLCFTLFLLWALRLNATHV